MALIIDNWRKLINELQKKDQSIRNPLLKTRENTIQKSDV